MTDLTTQQMIDAILRAMQEVSGRFVADHHAAQPLRTNTEDKIAARGSVETKRSPGP
jgi:hypothetical protein